MSPTKRSSNHLNDTKKSAGRVTKSKVSRDDHKHPVKDQVIFKEGRAPGSTDFDDNETPSSAGKPLNSMKCCVCFDSPEKCAVTPCGHLYCTDCLYKALTSQVKATRHKGCCAICRRMISYYSITFLEFKLPDKKS